MPIYHNQLETLPDGTERVLRPIANEALGAISGSVHENVVIAGATIPTHKHAVVEIIVCLSGTAECSFNGGSPEKYQSGSVLIIPPNTLHTIRNIGTELLRQLAFFPSGSMQTEWLESQGSVHY